MHALSLHHLTLLDATTEELVKIASELGCAHVCLFTTQPADGVGIRMVRDEDVDALRRKMDATNISVCGISSFPMLPNIDWARYEAGLERGARLGARVANIRIVDTDESRATDNFAKFGQLCRRAGIRPCIEFTGFHNINAVPQALRIIEQTGCGALTLDPLHIVRTGTPWETIVRLDPNLIGYVQICDGPLNATAAAAYQQEQAINRLPPGDGKFPLARLLSIVPPELPLSIEVPSRQLQERGLGPRERAREIVTRTRAHLASLGFV